MRFRVNAVFMLFACAASGLALGQQTRSETDVSGNWMMSADLFGSTTYLRMELKQAGDKLSEPAVVLRESGGSRMARFPGDIERTYWLTGHGDLLQLLLNTIRWVSHNERVVHVEGAGSIEVFCWETSPGYAIHLLNYTNPSAQHGWLRSVNPPGPQKVTMRLPSGVKVRSVALLRAEQSPLFEFRNQMLQVTVSSLEDYEVAAITVG
jgi:hypothetical protein